MGAAGRGGAAAVKALRRAVAATFWRHRNGAARRAVPAGFGPWRRRKAVCALGARPAIPAKRNKASVRCPDVVCVHRALPKREALAAAVGRLRGRLKEWRAVATRRKETARPFMGVFRPAAAPDGRKSAIKGKRSSSHRTYTRRPIR